jgi:hypothetical protein
MKCKGIESPLQYLKLVFPILNAWLSNQALFAFCPQPKAILILLLCRCLSREKKRYFGGFDDESKELKFRGGVGKWVWGVCYIVFVVAYVS